MTAILGALGLSEAAGVMLVAPKYGVWMAGGVSLAILGLFAIIFGGYFLYQRARSRKRREVFSAAIEAQTTATPKGLSDPNQRAALDKLRQKFQVGLQEYRSRDKNIYDLPWYIIIGEPGSGKTEAIRHSGIDFPPGLNNELQGSGGTVNMDWWFTNHGIILDTAGRLLFNEAPAGETPEWNEFLKLLRKARSHCPVNGVFIVLSVESLIKDSADRIAQKASRLAQQLDLIQRTLDVRFPVFVLVTKCDLLTGFRDFFESVDDPLLQHQMFGWSNPDPLDARFRPELVGEHLRSVAQRLRRRRLALLRESVGRRLDDTGKMLRSSYQYGEGSSGVRRVEEVESLFALPDSIMRLAPRLQRYLETIFVAGEWSAKPVFLRGIYFTSSMREGKALDEAIAFATGLPLDQLPEDQSWEKNRAFFLRDLFMEKVFRESGLVTRATNTLKLLRTRRVALFGSLAGALLLFLVFAVLGARSLNRSVGREAAHWEAGATNFSQGTWQRPVVSVSPQNPLQFVDSSTNLIDGRQSLAAYQRNLMDVVNQGFSVGWIFKPASWLFRRGVYDRPEAQRVVFEAGVLNPLVLQTQIKMGRTNAIPRDPAAVDRHRDALVALMQLEADGIISGPERGHVSNRAAAERYLRAFFSYLTESSARPDSNLVEVMAWTYAREGSKHKPGWPPAHLLGGSSLEANRALAVGLTNYYTAMTEAQTNIHQEMLALNDLVSKLGEYHQQEQTWLAGGTNPCAALQQALVPVKAEVDAAWTRYRAHTNLPAGALTNLTARYHALESSASNASASALLVPVHAIVLQLPEVQKTQGLFQDIQQLLGRFVSAAAGSVRSSYLNYSSIIPSLEREQLTPVRPAPQLPWRSAHEARWALFKEACELESASLDPGPEDIGSEWSRFREWTLRAAAFETNSLRYDGPLAEPTTNVCGRILVLADQAKRARIVTEYLRLVVPRLTELTNGIWNVADVGKARDLFAGLEKDLAAGAVLGDQAKRLELIRPVVHRAKGGVLDRIDEFVSSQFAFPVRADAPTTMDARSLGGGRQLLEVVASHLADPVWSSSPESMPSFSRLRGKLTNYVSIVSCLTDKDGAVAPFQVSIPAWESLPDRNDRQIVSALRFLRLSDGQTTAEDELTRPERPTLARVPADRPVTMTFRKVRGDGPVAQDVRLGPWWVLRAIREGRADRLTDAPNKWRVRIPLEDKSTPTPLKGHASFDVQLPSATPFPTREEWPR